jgi:putative acyl-CoA dehydrogenase
MSDTHSVTNQVPILEGYDLFTSDVALTEATEREGAAWARDALTRYGSTAGSNESYEWGRLANNHPPELASHDRCGHRIDEVTFHPAWHELMRQSMHHEVHNLPWRNAGTGANVARAAKHYMLVQTEAGHACPITMTFAALPALRHDSGIAAEWEPRLLSTDYDARLIPAADKSGVTIGMAMTEKQGGSDVRANTSRAVPTGRGGPGEEYLLTGHKWFCSAPMSDAFLTLAQTDAGLSCFLVPRYLPDGTRNTLRIQRLKSKLGNRSNASSEIEYENTWARMLGEDGRGINTIIEMVHHTRLDCISGSAGIMRQALAQAVHHGSHRSAFGKTLREHDLMATVLADLALELEGAVALMARVARAYDEAAGNEQERAFARIATAVGKFWVCKRAPHMIYEAMECLGGNGYVEESMLPRLYREAPVNAIWEGSGNVICLDVLRAIGREPDSLPVLLDEIRSVSGSNDYIDRGLVELESELASHDTLERRARVVVEKMAVLLQAALLVRYAPAQVSDAFSASRLAGSGRVFGALPSQVDLKTIIQRATPIV